MQGFKAPPVSGRGKQVFAVPDSLFLHHSVKQVFQPVPVFGLVLRMLFKQFVQPVPCVVTVNDLRHTLFPDIDSIPQCGVQLSESQLFVENGFSYFGLVV